MPRVSKEASIDDAFLENAILELAQRIVESRFKRKSVRDTEAAASLLCRVLSNCTRETFAIITLDQQNRLIDVHTLQGKEGRVDIEPRDVVAAALKDDANKIVIGHNHPNGQLLASDADLQLTERLRSLLEEVGVTLLDHIVFADSSWVSID